MKQEPEKRQKRGRSGWPGAEKDIGHEEEQVRPTKMRQHSSYNLTFLSPQESRLDSNKTVQQLRREKETPGARQACLDADRAAKQLRRKEETPEVRKARLDADRAAQQLIRKRETSEVRPARVDANTAA